MDSSVPRRLRVGLVALGDGLLLTVVVLGVIALVGTTLLICAGTLLFAAVAGDVGLRAPTTTVGWISGLSHFASEHVTASSNMAVALVAASVFVVVGSRRRSGVAMWVGLVCGVIIAGTLLLLAADSARIDGITERALASARAEAAADVSAPPEPTPTGPPPLALATVRDEMRRMLGITLAAVGDAPVDERGVVLSAGDVTLGASACGENGTVLSAAFAFRPDEAAAGARVLDAWVSAGYSADRAIQEDIRYSVDRPVERMRLRDSTSIDGLVHVSVEGRCAAED
jgi:hypothetical protein